jgi:hypothetical protein
LIEAAESVLVHDKIVGLRLEFRNNIRVPGVSDQNSTFSTVRGMNALPDAEPQGAAPGSEILQNLAPVYEI